MITKRVSVYPTTIRVLIWGGKQLFNSRVFLIMCPCRALHRTVLPCQFYTVLRRPVRYCSSLRCCGSKFTRSRIWVQDFWWNWSRVWTTKSLKLSTTWYFVIISNFRLAGYRFSIRVRNTLLHLCCNVCSKYILWTHCITHASLQTFQTTW